MISWEKVIHLASGHNPAPSHRIEFTDQEWKEKLDPEVYAIARKGGTERPHSSDMCTSFEPGRYACACCDTLLFDSRQKFDSGTGWPSFTVPLEENVISYHKDTAFGMIRVETRCSVCDAHLGHVFPDGPAPSGLRYCINALALKKS
jgi:peptide-methionine (R)-S-oxide reductase